VKMVLHAIHSLGVHVPEISLELSLARHHHNVDCHGNYQPVFHT